MTANMETKAIEVRDRGTLIPCLAVRLDGYNGNANEAWLMRRAGYGEPCVLFTRAQGGTAAYDPYSWGDRTMKIAHNYVSENWAKISSGDVVDVEFVLGETSASKRSQRVSS